MLNRPRLFAKIDQRLSEASDGGQHVGVLMLRTQRMREFDLLFGYESGERVAAAVCATIVAALRSEDEVVQVGDCDFAVILPNLRNRNHAALAAAKLVRALQAPLLLDGQEVVVPVSVGAAVFPGDGDDSDLLCRHADIACGEAVASSDRFALYSSPELPEAFAHGELRDAIAFNRMQLFFQPIVALQGSQVARVEALSRWSHPVRGPIAPETFVHVAEQTGLIAELTRWNLNASLRHAAEARHDGFAFGLSVNLSVSVLQRANFVEEILGALRFWNVAPETVVLEVTESGLMSDLAYCERVMGQLRGHGFGLAIDDFGTGYSSMAYLKRLPVTELKIDKTFVLDMRRDVRVVKLVGSIIDLSHHLGVEVVAEGVDEAATLEVLRGMGCDHAQGYHLGYPLPAAEAIALLARHATSPSA